MAMDIPLKQLSLLALLIKLEKTYAHKIKRYGVMGSSFRIPRDG